MSGVELTGDVSGASVVDLCGSAAGLRLDVSGGSRLDLSAADGGGRRPDPVRWLPRLILVTGRLKADASGGSRLSTRAIRGWLDRRLGRVRGGARRN